MLCLKHHFQPCIVSTLSLAIANVMTYCVSKHVVQRVIFGDPRGLLSNHDDLDAYVKDQSVLSNGQLLPAPIRSLVFPFPMRYVEGRGRHRDL